MTELSTVLDAPTALAGVAYFGAAAPKRKHYFWTAREEKILRETYPTGGLNACLALLPDRSAPSIYNRAGALGVRKTETGLHSYERYSTNEHIDALIRRTYLSGKKNAISELGRSIGRPSHWISRRAAMLGITPPRFREPFWTEAEIEIISENATIGLRAIQKRLLKHGFKRTETAICVKLKRIGADTQDPNRFTASGLATLLGVDRSVVMRWISLHGLKAVKRGTSPTAERDLWQIHRSDIRSWIINNATSVDIRKVDKFWFIDLLANKASA